MVGFMLTMSSCSNESQIELEYSFEAAQNVKEVNEEFDQISFKSFKDLNLGFYKGYLWIKLNVSNGSKAESFMVINDDLMNRNYRFYKVDPSNNQMKPLSFIADTTKQDFRTFSSTHPNFKLDLAPNESATFLISTYSDGRWLDATPKIMGMTEYFSLVTQNTIVSVVFFAIIFTLLLINLYQWSLVRQKIYFYYIFYILTTFIMYAGLEGHLHFFDLKHHTVDHLVFLSVRIWFFSLLIYTANFLDIKKLAPNYFRVFKLLLIMVLGGTTLYQFIFFKTSIEHLHFYENTFSFVWILLLMFMVALSAKKRRVELKYYSIPILCLLVFTLVGLIDGQFQLLPGNPFFYIKIGTVTEFIGFTYFIAHLMRRRLKEIEEFKNDLVENRKELLTTSKKMEEKVVHNHKGKNIEKTDLVGVFKLLEHSLSSDSDWEEFKLRFEELNPCFFDNLLNTHPDLSKSEIRLLTLIKIGYSHKQTAEILGIEPNSVKKSKNRARKKLSLPQLIILKDYLLNF